MRKISLLPLSLLAVLVFLSSCKKESVSNTPASTPDETISVKIAPNQLYLMDLTGAGTVSIRRQAIHFLVSEAGVNTETATPVYKYIPATDFIGTDEVVLVSTKTVTNYSATNTAGCHERNNDAATTTSTSTVSKNISLKITVDN